jgi:hypothetical protein
MPYRRTPRKAFQDIGAEDVRNQSCALVKPRLSVGERTDTGRFLAAMLEGVQSEERQLRSVIDATQADDAALLVGPFVELGG